MPRRSLGVEYRLDGELKRSIMKFRDREDANLYIDHLTASYAAGGHDVTDAKIFRISKKQGDNQ